MRYGQAGCKIIGLAREGPKQRTHHKHARHELLRNGHAVGDLQLPVALLPWRRVKVLGERQTNHAAVQ